MISAVFNDFFNCFSMPTLILNQKMETIFTYKIDNTIKNSFYLSKALNHLKVNSFSEGKNHIHINIICTSKNIHRNARIFLF